MKNKKSWINPYKESKCKFCSWEGRVKDFDIDFKTKRFICPNCKMDLNIGVNPSEFEDYKGIDTGWELKPAANINIEKVIKEAVKEVVGKKDEVLEGLNKVIQQVTNILTEFRTKNDANLTDEDKNYLWKSLEVLFDLQTKLEGE